MSKSVFHKSIDGGDNFSKISSGLPEQTPEDANEKLSRLVLEVSPANPEVVYVLGCKKDYTFKGLYKSTNSATTFTKTGQDDDFFEGGFGGSDYGDEDDAWFEG